MLQKKYSSAFDFTQPAKINGGVYFDYIVLHFEYRLNENYLLRSDFLAILGARVVF